MTAKEIVEKYSSQCLSLNEEMEEAIIKYAKQKCTEQRELCDDAHLESLSSFNGEYFKDAVSDAIHEATEPEIK